MINVPNELKIYLYNVNTFKFVSSTGINPVSGLKWSGLTAPPTPQSDFTMKMISYGCLSELR